MNAIVSKGAPALLLASLIACAPEGEQRTVQPASGDDACAAADAVLADGIQTGDELVLTFECLNRNGDFDPLAPVVYAMDAERTPDGAPLFDLWIDAINQALTHAEGGSLTIALSPGDIANAVGGLLGFVQSGAPDIALDLVAEAIDYGVVDGAMSLGGEMSGAIGALGAGGGADLSAWLGAMEVVLCGDDFAAGAQCRSNLTRALSGATQVEGGEAAVYDPSDPANDDLRQSLAWLLYAGGDVARAENANRQLAQALAGMGEPIESLRFGPRPSLLEFATADLLPALYGDDLSTPDTLEGYPSRNPAQSALYGLLLKLTDPVILDALSKATPETRALVESYFVVTPGVNGYATPYRTGACLTPSQAEETYGVAYTGLEQLIRILVATNIKYDEAPAACSGAFNLLIPLVTPYVELSGTTSIGALVLEIFTQLPLPLVQLATTLFNNEFVVELSNQLCEMNVVADDTEALEASVYSEQTMAMALPLLGAVNHAGKIPDLVQLLDDLWNTPTLCHMTPTLRLAFSADAPGSGGDGGVPEASPYFPNPQAPIGSTPHDLVTEPLLAAVMDLSAHSGVLIPPIEAGLASSEDALYNTFMGLGRMANNPESALSDVGLLLSEAGQISSGEANGAYVDLAPAANALGQEELAYALFLTLGSDSVRNALVNGSAEYPTSILDRTSTLIKNDSLSAYLALLEALLLDIQANAEVETAGE